MGLTSDFTFVWVVPSIMTLDFLKILEKDHGDHRPWWPFSLLSHVQHMGLLHVLTRFFRILYRLDFLFNLKYSHMHHDYLTLLLHMNVTNNQLGRIRLQYIPTIQPRWRPDSVVPKINRVAGIRLPWYNDFLWIYVRKPGDIFLLTLLFVFSISITAFFVVSCDSCNTSVLCVAYTLFSAHFPRSQTISFCLLNCLSHKRYPCRFEKFLKA